MKVKEQFLTVVLGFAPCSFQPPRPQQQGWHFVNIDPAPAALASKPGFPFCLSRMAPLYTRPSPSRDEILFVAPSVQLQRLSLSPR